jgi:hypothetical protein
MDMYITDTPKSKKKMVDVIAWGCGCAGQAKFETQGVAPEACSSHGCSKIRLGTIKTS